MLRNVHPFVWFCFAFFALFYGLTQAPVFGDPDTGWHMASGALWSAHGIAPQDPWSWSVPSGQWINYSWAFGIITEWLYRYTGNLILYPLTLFWYAGLVALMSWHALKQGVHMTALLIVLVVVLMILYPGVLLRPNMVTLLFAITAYFFLRNFERRAEWMVWLFLPLLTVLWINLHGGFIVLFLMLAVFAIEALIRGQWDLLARLVAVGCLCYIVTFINPYGYAIWDGVLIALQSDFNVEIREWAPTNFRDNIFMLALLGLLLVASGFDDNNLRLADRLWIFVLFYFAVTSQRHSVMLALFSIPFVSVALTHTMRALPFASVFLRLGDRMERTLQTPELRPGVVVVLLITFFTLASPFPRDLLLGKSPDMPRDKLSSEDLAYLRLHYGDEQILNHYDLGGYLIWWGRGNPKVFVDGRAGNLYPDSLLLEYRDFMRFAGQNIRAQEIQKKYGFRYVLMPKANDLTEWFKNDLWEADYIGESVVVFRRKR